MTNSLALRLGMGIVTSLLLVARDAPAQSLLERLEKRLNEAGVQIQPPAPAPGVADEGTPEALPPAPSARSAPPGFLGLTADEKRGGLEVLAVRAGGPADAAGIKPGDRLVSLGGVEMASLDDLAAMVSKLPAGSRVEVVVARSGRSQTLSVVLAARDGEGAPAPEAVAPPAANPQRPAPGIVEGPASLGVRALPLTPELQRRYGLPVARGAVVESIQPGSAADQYGVPIGAAIVAVDGARVDAPDTLAAIIAGAKVGDVVELSYYQRDQVFRKLVRLGPAVPPAAPPEERPFFRRLERVFGEVAPLVRDPQPESLHGRVEFLEAQVEALERRLAELEAELDRTRAPRPGNRPPPVPQPLRP